MSRPVRHLLAAALLLLAAAPPAARAQGPAGREPAPWGHGTHALRMILHDLKFQPLRSLDEAVLEPERTILVVLGETWPLDQVPPAGVRGFVERGGAVLIATDRTRRPSPVEPWEETFAVAVREAPVTVVAGFQANAYRGHPDMRECPLLRAGDNAGSPLFRDIRLGVATNRPGSLDVRRSPVGATLKVLARYPRECMSSDAPRLSIQIEGQPPALPPIFAAGGDWGAGRVLVLADHSVFINDMMLQTDNDNIPFAYNCLEWLSADRRRRVFFCEEGEVNTKFDVPVAEPPLPPPGPWLNELIQGIEQENLFNQTILRRFPPGQIFRVLLLALTGLLLLYGLARLMKSRYRVEPAAAPLAQAVNRQLALQAVLHQRHQDMLRADNLWEAARTLARQCFEPGAAPNGNGAPRVRVQGGWWERRRLSGQVNRLWRLAFGARPERVTATEFVDLVREMEAVKAALAKGTVVIQPLA
jgi:hypothetical protein